MFEQTKNRLLYLVADEEVKSTDLSLPEIVELAIKGGVDIVQYRNKIDKIENFSAKAVELKELCKTYSVPFIINDNLDVALAVEADGIHIGQGDLPLSYVREKFHGIVGYSVKTVEQALFGMENKADYLGAGTVFSTSSKADAGYTIGTEGLRKIVTNVAVPVFAIGGINLANVQEVISTGVKGIAVISAITMADNPLEAAKKLKQAINSGL